MQNEAITVTKILRIYAALRHDDYMAGIVEDEVLKAGYKHAYMAKWECLQIMLGFGMISETMDFVRNLAQRNTEAA